MKRPIKKMISVFLAVLMLLPVLPVLSALAEGSDEGCVHVPEIIPAVFGFCTVDGLTEGEKCSLCGEILTPQQVIPKGHIAEIVIPAREPTCTLNGNTAQIRCSRCELYLAKSATIPMLGHIDEDGDEICDRCSEPYRNSEPVYTNTISVNDYTINRKGTHVITVPYEFDGWDSLLNFKGDYAKLTFDCYNEDTLLYTCAEIDKPFYTNLPVTSVFAYLDSYGWSMIDMQNPPSYRHWYREGPIAFDTFTVRLTSEASDGYAYSALSDTKPFATESCETFIFDKNFVLPEDAHTDDHAPVYGELIECIPHTCTEDGLAYRECSVCAYKAYEIVEKAHAPEVIPGTAATCTETGLTDGVVCSVCGEILTEPQILDKLQHTPVDLPRIIPTCTEDGLVGGVVCAVCGEILNESVIIPAAGHVDADDDAYCDVCGEKVRDKTIIEIILDFFRRIIDFFGNLFG